MRKRLLHIIVYLFAFAPLIRGQADIVPPVSPILDIVTVSVITGFSEISWTLSPSPDVSGYVVYSYVNDEGYAIDTVSNPLISDFVHMSQISSELSRSYVVSAIDSAGNISTLSNAISTIFATAELDSCNGKIDIAWNGYSSYPREVTGYTILVSLNGGTFTETVTVSKETNSYALTDFSFDAQYCFIIKATLQGNYSSHSNKTCLSTKMQKPPRWINADYATVVSDNEILLSFRIDPESEINSYILEKKTGASGSFGQIYHFTRSSDSFLYSDGNADISRVNYYRLAAVNNCSIPVTISNLASNIVTELAREEDDITLSWNQYRDWKGTVISYGVFIRTGKDFEERYTLSPGDTSLTLPYSGIMYEVSGNEVCFMIKAIEGLNPYGGSAESLSSVICTSTTEMITVPNAFTPDNNLVNDLFLPVLSFTPLEYHLLITDLKRKKVFESRDSSLPWDGNSGKDPLPEGVYLWFLELQAPSGKALNRTGTVAIMRPGN
ncbi:MAG: gliding motility-associated C-terminal domain-containing protein [Bacteroidota bacterium]